MPTLSRRSTHALRFICLLACAWQLTGCYDHAQAASHKQPPCIAERDMALQSHFMIWHSCIEADETPLK
jgi:hypothetical protein